MTLDVKLKKKERQKLEKLINQGVHKARVLARARVLLLIDESYNTNTISSILKVHRQRIWRIKKRFKTKGLDSALEEKSRPGQPTKYDKKKKVEIIAYACTDPPNGRKRWTIRLLAETLSKQKGFGTVNRETIRLILKKATPSLG